MVKALVPFRSCSPTPILRQRFRSTDGLVGSTLCAAHTMTGIQALPHTHIECIRATSHFEHQARMLDPQGFAAVTAATEDADIYDWLQWKLRHGLSTWKKPGEAGWIWKSRPGRVVRVLVWCTGARESERTAPYACTMVAMHCAHPGRRPSGPRTRLLLPRFGLGQWSTLARAPVQVLAGARRLPRYIESGTDQGRQSDRSTKAMAKR